MQSQIISQIETEVPKHELRKLKRTYAEQQDLLESIQESEIDWVDYIGDLGDVIDYSVAESFDTRNFCPACFGRGKIFFDQETGYVPCPECDLTGGLR